MLVFAVGCGYEAPLDEDAPALLNAIEGDVLFAGTGDPATTYVLVFDDTSPGPPVGTGSPVTFAAVAGDAYDGGEGPVSAPFSLTRIGDGGYFLNALMDVDGDFNPFSSALAGATCGDWVGAYLTSLAGTDQGVVEVRGGELVSGVSVLVGQRLDLERPAFELVGAPELSLALTTGPVPLLFRVQATSVATAFSDEPDPFLLQLGPACTPAAVPYCELMPSCACDVAAFADCSTALWVWMVDADADGLPDPYPDEALAAAGLFDIWPRVFLEYTGEQGTFEHGGSVLPERWVTQAHPLAAELGYVLLTGGDPSTLGPIGQPFPAHSLSVTFSPVFVHYHADGAMGEDANGPFDLVDARVTPDAVPAGGYATTLVSFTGQTWTVPNEIGVLGLPSLDPTFDAATQAGAVVVAP